LKIRDTIDSLLRNPNARFWGGKLFERAVHCAFRKGFEFEPEAIDDDAPSLLVQIKKAESEAEGYFHTLSVRADKGPLSLTAETASTSSKTSVLFQMTVSPSHSLNLKGITELTNELPAFAKKRICIVFVVPDHDTTRKPYKRQNIVIAHKHVSDLVVAYEQYIYYITFQWTNSDMFSSSYIELLSSYTTLVKGRGICLNTALATGGLGATACNL
jgi:hypothetical protein